MRRILHLSDLHFGRVESAILDPLIDFVKEKKCDVIVISGDLTQRATREQFRQAKEFLGRLDVKQIVVPGNHDIPLYKIWARVFRPFRNFLNLISDDLEPVFVDDEVAIVGINTVSFWSPEGVFSANRFEALAKKFRSLSQESIKILVSHHAIPNDVMASRDLNFDLALAGHEHEAKFLLGTWTNQHSHIFVQAGTATSTRVRHGQPNSFNLIDIDGPNLKIESWEWSADGSTFTEKRSGSFVKGEGGWVSSVGKNL